MGNDLLIVLGQLPAIGAGFLNTLILVAVAACGSLLVGVGLTPLLMSPRKGVSRMVGAYCEVMRCIPFLLFVYLLYFGLPSLGLRMSNWTTGLLALVVYNSAYMALLLQGVWKDLPRENIEAARAFGYHGYALVRRIIMPPVLMRAIPLMGNQLIQIVKDSAFLTVIAVLELTSVMNAIQSTHFIPFAAFATAVFLYWLLCLCIEVVTGLLTRYAQERRS
ncbi:MULTISPECIES: amino acid ABC transporter permease [Pseudomonas]|uniref:Glutamine ABC transporter permease protein GlnM n=1 Tax=Pseudomonas fluorescens TaxID=294 RepID=A0A5E6T641_PSEFL|nr:MULTISPECIES: ABC transporter permease subunit [Pseudomonas]VVM83348.1 putative glutamine ABC transporter permease protein GlnM [Pseudomonas fluorescens]